MTSDVLVWLDVETSGLVAHEDALLEVAAIVTDATPELNRLVDEPFRRVVKYAPTVAHILREEANEYVQRMHDETGLWGRLSAPGALEVWHVDEELLAYVQQAAPIARQARVAGSSVRLDLNFAEEHLPLTYEHLHYRSIDVTALWSTMIYAGHEDALPTDRELADRLALRGTAGQAHEPLYDLEMSMERYREVMRLAAPRGAVR